MENTFLSQINAGEQPIGTLITIDSAEVAEIMSMIGFDWLFLDMEHGNLSLQSVQQMSQAIGNRCATFVRIPKNDGMWIAKVLDIGCEGIIVPHVNTAAEATSVVQAAKYPPIGKRGAGISRAHGYGLNFGAYMQTANEETAVIIQIEDIEAVRNLDAILKVEGVSGVLIGPYDLSGSMNMLGEVNHPEVQAQIKIIKQKCHEAAMPYGIFVMHAEAAQLELAASCSFAAVGLDSAMLIKQAKQALQICKGE